MGGQESVAFTIPWRIMTIAEKIRVSFPYPTYDLLALWSDFRPGPTPRSYQFLPSGSMKIPPGDLPLLLHPSHRIFCI